MAGADKSRSRPEPGVRIWAEAGVTVAVTDSPPQFIRYSFGMERTARGQDKKSVERAEKQLYEYCEQKVAERVESMSEMLVQAREELLESATEYPY